MKTLFTAGLAACAIAVAVGQSADEDLVTTLPGAEGMGFTNQYAGYLDLPNTEKHIFYWYVEAVESPETAPVALWTNGGPGCSGLTGFLTEQGPFHVSENGTLEKNDYAWNNVANMLFVEQPVGVGFSWSGNSADYSMGDWDAARDNFAAIQVFLERFPAVATNDFYITAESYGGHYMPTLAKYIMDHQPNSINFKGFAVGNPFTSKASNQIGEFNTIFGHQLTSNPLFHSWQDSCSGWYFAAKQAELAGSPPLDSRLKPYQCVVDEEMILGPVEFELNPYALDYPTCPKGPGDADDDDQEGASQRRSAHGQATRGGGRFGGAQRLALMRHAWADEPRLLAALEASLQKGAPTAAVRNGNATVETVGAYEPCSDDYATTYMNRPDVQAAIHVNGGAAQENNATVVWSECSRTIRYNMSDGRTPMMPIYSELLNASNAYDLKILVYSGDDDMVCATEGSQEWIYDLGFDTDPMRAWHSWHYDDATFGRQVGGYAVNFNESQMSGHFAFVTAHGCGHEVPTYKPQLALELFKNYLSGRVYA